MFSNIQKYVDAMFASNQCYLTLTATCHLTVPTLHIV